MKLFQDFDAVKFPEENLLLITHSRYLYYTYSFDAKIWHKYQNAGNNLIHIEHYPDVSQEELESAMGGIFPQKETDFARLCPASEWNVWNMLNFLSEDYPEYLSPYGATSGLVRSFLYESDVCYKSYEKIRALLDTAVLEHRDPAELPDEVRKLSFAVLGRDIYAERIDIVDGHNGSSFFWIQPVRIIDYADTDAMENVAEMKGVEISIEEDDVGTYLAPLLFRHFDADLEANKSRGNANDFEWNLTYNFYTYQSVSNILKDIRELIRALSAGKTCEVFDTSRFTKSSVSIALIIDFYKRFLYRMEYMMTVGKEKGYDLISFMGP